MPDAKVLAFPKRPAPPPACRHCGREYKRQSACERHERTCLAAPASAEHRPIGWNWCAQPGWVIVECICGTTIAAVMPGRGFVNDADRKAGNLLVAEGVRLHMDGKPLDNRWVICQD